MTSKKSYLRQVALATGLLMTPMTSMAVEPTKLSTVDAEGLFAAKVLPLLKEKCFACHGEDPKKIKGKLFMLTRADMLAGGESELPALIPGKPEKSPLYLAITWKDEDLEMPPKENDRLDKQQIEWVHSWIAAGAPWPQDVAAAKEAAGDRWDVRGGVTVSTSGGLSDDWTNRKYDEDKLWAYQPIKKSTIPSKGHPVDAFLQTRMPKGLAVADQAKPVTLIRRITFDLTGLPPTPMEVAAFIEAWEQGEKEAWNALIDRLLDSPHYGEQMATRWLDVVRYADSSGFSNDWVRPHAWRYRDYVVRSFNQDKPYDQFVREQIAGDEIKPKDPEHVIATGFLRMGPWEHTSMSVKAITRQQYLDDVVNSVGVTFLANELRCAKCHDHKFDPIPTKDYYRMQAIFSPVQFADRPLPWQEFENTDGIAADKKRHQKLKADKGIRSILTLPEAERPVQEFDKESESKGQGKVNNKRRQQLGYQLKRANPLAFSVKSTGNEQIHILKGGSIESPGELVSPGMLSLFSGSEKGSAVTTERQGRRRQLAEWIASENNPLTARVIVNRIWQWRFGQALAGNPNNFGGTGKKPTHPELLDWLASTFMENDWSFKEMDRLLLRSAAYRRASSHPDPEKLGKLDPKSVSYAAFHPRRLTAEELRDAMLATSGELNRKIGGIPAHLEINEEVAMQPRHIMGSVGPAYQADPTPTQRNRRTLYAERIRTLADPMLEVFNKPGPDLSCEQRDSSTVAPQAFTLLNSPIIRARALAFAAKLEKGAKGDLAGQVKRGFHRAYQRGPTEKELQRCLAYVKQSTKHHQAHPPVKVDPPKYVIREMVEEMTGLAFWWVEDLDVYASDSYVPDLKPWDVKPRTRALADLCLALFNANEFTYIY